MTRLYVELQEGLIFGVSTDDPERFKDVELVLIDHDTEGCLDRELGDVTDETGTQPAWVRFDEITAATITSVRTVDERFPDVPDPQA